MSTILLVIKVQRRLVGGDYIIYIVYYTINYKA